MPTSSDPSRFYRVVLAVALVFLAKFCVFAWLVTPLWDVPDESGHFSYVEDILDGEWPVLGKARMGVEVMHSWKSERSRPAVNWIAQHPPAFYVLDAPLLAFARASGFDFEHQVRTARVLSALFGALTFIGMALFLSRATGRNELALAGATFLVATPTFSHLSTGVTHDTMVACTAAWAAYWVARWIHSDTYRHCLYAGGLMAICAVTKLTGLVVAIPLFMAIAWRLWQRRSDRLEWLFRTTALWFAFFLPTILWVIRNWITIGHAFPLSSNIRHRDLVPIGFFEYMLSFPFWQHTLLNYVALIGWNGSDGGALKLLHANGWMARYFLTLIGTAALCVATSHLLRPLFDRQRLLITMGLALLLGWGYARLPLPTLATLVCILLLSALSLNLLGHACDFLRSRGTGWLLATSSICIFFFLLVYYEHLWAMFSGNMKATHGRYLYPIAPFLTLILAWPFRHRVAARTALCASLLALLLADAFFLRQVTVLYGQV